MLAIFHSRLPLRSRSSLEFTLLCVHTPQSHCSEVHIRIPYHPRVQAVTLRYRISEATPSRTSRVHTLRGQTPKFSLSLRGRLAPRLHCQSEVKILIPTAAKQDPKCRKSRTPQIGNPKSYPIFKFQILVTI